MSWVYILQSEANGRFYIGSTGNLDRRLSEHNSGKTKSLKQIRPLRLVFKQEFSGSLMAGRMERKLKAYKNRSIIEQIILDGVIKSDMGH